MRDDIRHIIAQAYIYRPGLVIVIELIENIDS